MDAVTDPTIEEVVMMASSQVGKTEMINNVVGYFIHQEPAPMLVVQPTIEMGETWSKDRLAPMLRDTPAIRGLVGDPRSRDGANTLRMKEFPGGRIAVAGANSAASLASRPVRLVLLDEVDRFPPSAGTEGDPVKLAMKRASTWWNRKVVLTSTPTVKGASRIEQAFEETDQRVFEVPCPYCGYFQRLLWRNLKWEKTEKGLPENTRYACEVCPAEMTEGDKHRMIRNGKWMVTNPEIKKKAGFHLSELYSPWSTWQGMVENFYEAKKRTETLKVFVNTSLGETWEEEGLTIDDSSLMGRREEYTSDSLPREVVLLTIGVDIQEDRIHAAVKGWGKDEESWLIAYLMFQGKVTTDGKPWDDLSLLIERTWSHEGGFGLKSAAVCIDSGFATKQVYEFVRKREGRRVWATKGVGGAGVPVIRLSTKRNRAGVRLALLGTDTCKELIYSRLRVDEFGAGYMHFPKNVDEEYFKELTAEKQVTKFIRGFPSKIWQKIRPRNEALDCEVGALSALVSLNVNIDQLAARNQQRMVKEEKVKEKPGTYSPRAHKRGGFVTRW